MIRIVLENLLLFFLPTFLYLAYVFMTRGRAEPDGNGKAASARLMDDAPLLYLFAAGALLVVATLFLFGSNTGTLPHEGYTPPSIKDGRIEPGRVN
jgi:hypothetical protein